MQLSGSVFHNVVRSRTVSVTVNLLRLHVTCLGVVVHIFTRDVCLPWFC